MNVYAFYHSPHFCPKAQSFPSSADSRALCAHQHWESFRQDFVYLGAASSLPCVPRFSLLPFPSQRRPPSTILGPLRGPPRSEDVTGERWQSRLATWGLGRLFSHLPQIIKDSPLVRGGEEPSSEISWYTRLSRLRLNGQLMLPPDSDSRWALVYLDTVSKCFAYGTPNYYSWFVIHYVKTCPLLMAHLGGIQGSIALLGLHTPCKLLCLCITSCISYVSLYNKIWKSLECRIRKAITTDTHLSHHVALPWQNIVRSACESASCSVLSCFDGNIVRVRLGDRLNSFSSSSSSYPTSSSFLTGWFVSVSEPPRQIFTLINL